MKKKTLTPAQRHELLLQNRNHYLWNVPYNKWTEKDYTNLMQGINEKTVVLKRKPPGNAIGQQPVKAVLKNGEELQYRSISDASRKTGISKATIHADVNGLRVLKREKFPRWEKLTL